MPLKAPKTLHWPLACLLIAGLFAALFVRPVNLATLTPDIIHANQRALPAGPLTLVNYNMLHPGPTTGSQAGESAQARADMLADALAETRPDLVFLQEAYRTRSGNVVDYLRETLNQRLASENISYNSVWLAANGDPTGITGFMEGEALLSRYRIDGARSLLYATQSTTVFREKRKALLATLTGENIRLEIAVVHLSTHDDFNPGQASELQTLFATETNNTVIVAGDFNATSNSDAVEVFTKNGYLDSWIAAGKTDKQGLSTGIYDLYNPEPQAHHRIDFVLVSNASVNSADTFLGEAKQTAVNDQTQWLWGSDHIGQIMQIHPVYTSNEAR
jgi:endonuclease/exonuclease/phosphatase family metal-dependent hydrolase